jgi:hypothetical protein
MYTILWENLDEVCVLQLSSNSVWPCVCLQVTVVSILNSPNSPELKKAFDWLAIINGLCRAFQHQHVHTKIIFNLTYSKLFKVISN